MTEVEETLKRIQSHKGVIGTMVVNAEGIPIRTTLDNSTTVQYAGLLHQLTMKAKSTVRDIDPQNDLTFLRIRSKKHEIMVAPGNGTRSFLLKMLLRFAGLKPCFKDWGIVGSWRRCGS
ncbi:dynein light chain roadblock-type 2 isoform X1 [Rattus norvegicus]|uniref:dynein light chain roadblock-type 2 isoform X1 n=1 Tax=Rattus norvegicus TaxID=10116 RepID=UPI001E23F6CD